MPVIGPGKGKKMKTWERERLARSLGGLGATRMVAFPERIFRANPPKFAH